MLLRTSVDQVYRDTEGKQGGQAEWAEFLIEGHYILFGLASAPQHLAKRASMDPALKHERIQLSTNIATSGIFSE